jgi:hypothetical protein
LPRQGLGRRTDARGRAQGLLRGLPPVLPPARRRGPPIWYEKVGLHPYAFFMREAAYPPKNCKSAGADCEIEKVTPSDYNQLRNGITPGYPTPGSRISSCVGRKFCPATAGAACIKSARAALRAVPRRSTCISALVIKELLLPGRRYRYRSGGLNQGCHPAISISSARRCFSAVRRTWKGKISRSYNARRRDQSVWTKMPTGACF